MNYLLNFRMTNVNSGGPVVPGRIEQVAGAPTPLGTEADLRLESKITFLIHGYNVTHTAGQRSLLQLAAHLATSHEGAFVAVLWPGDDPRLSFASFPIEGRDADDTAAQLVRFIDRVVQPTAELSFVSHSLGARVVMETIKRLPGAGGRIGQICLMAAAMDNFCLASPTGYRSAVQAAARVVVLASEGDRVLRYAYPAGDFLESFLFASELATQALGFRGPARYRGQVVPAQVFPVQIPRARGVDHGDYLPASPPTAAQMTAMNFSGSVLQGNTTPVYP